MTWRSDLADPEVSIVALDSKGDLRRRLAPFRDRWRPGTTIRVLNFTDSRRTTDAWNPYAEERDAGDALRDAEDFCQAATTEKPGLHDSPFWDA